MSKNQYPASSRNNRLLAIERGEKTYDGVPCKKCGSTLKYVTSYGCVPCNVEKGIVRLYDDELMAKYRTPEKARDYYARNKDKKKQINDVYYQTPKGKAARSNNSARRRARVRDQSPDDVDFDKIKAVYDECRRLCDVTGIPHEVDHIIPISKGGLHHQDNLQILTMIENRKKGSSII